MRSGYELRKKKKRRRRDDDDEGGGWLRSPAESPSISQHGNAVESIGKCGRFASKRLTQNLKTTTPDWKH
jgi:hypothetical protein